MGDLAGLKDEDLLIDSSTLFSDLLDAPEPVADDVKVDANAWMQLSKPNGSVPPSQAASPAADAPAGAPDGGSTAEDFARFRKMAEEKKERERREAELQLQRQREREEEEARRRQEAEERNRKREE